MKRVFFTIALFVMTVSPCLAASGKAIIPRYTFYTGYKAYFALSNITGSPVDVALTFIRQHNSSGQPNILTDCNTSSSAGTFVLGYGTSVTNYSETSGASVKFTIAPYESAELYIVPNAGGSCVAADGGYGFIEWTQSSSQAPVALVAHSYGETTVPINGGLPF